MERAMSRYNPSDHRDAASALTEIVPPSDGREQHWQISSDEGSSPSLRVRTIERAVIIRVTDSEILEEEAVHAVGRGLRRLIGEGHTRLVVNFAEVRYISSEVLGILAGL